ncbi:cell division protein ZapE [Microbulbifer rhizosphaerae]|uniref:Cell division protein ZapE n=1 Tax=Microbulbifer rhizosphaerae TaxID=1562603 RepID=A0A7W4W949_9GAMM|nr:cell division protein ZapE [Microbulbifer rhizosphaerae]MBB3059378.1 cell division protein ZapE [Microbulbifer rhizosphaerae]
MSPSNSPLLSPLERYRRDLQRPDFIADPAQQAAVEQLQDLYRRLLTQGEAGGWRERLRAMWRGQGGPERGLYLWGGVGRGKTYLMDAFYESLPFEQKQRTHFHRFMREVHRELKTLAGERNPLEKVAERIAGRVRVLCFDEFFVSDITDAMILANLLDALFRRGVTLVATSNIEPAGLYRDGLQRARFLPAIALLERHTRVVNVDGGTDYRLRALEMAELYHWPLDDSADVSLARSFAGLMVESCEVQEQVDLDIEGRHIRALKVADDVAWFDFSDLCDGPRSQNDYIELAREYHTVLLANVLRFDERMEAQARRFINLVDEFYDRCVKLVISAEVPAEQLYGGRHLKFEFERTVSRLLEMQSREYLARPHRPD